MPIHWQKKGDYVVLELSGRFRHVDVLRALREIARENDLARAPLLADYRLSEEVATASEVRERVETFRAAVVEAAPGIRPRVGLLVEKTVHFGLGRMAALEAGDAMDIEVFTDEAEVLDFLLIGRGHDGESAPS